MKTAKEWSTNWYDRTATTKGLTMMTIEDLTKLMAEVQLDAIESAAAFVEGGSFLHGESGEARLARAAASGIRRLAADALKILEE